MDLLGEFGRADPIVPAGEDEGRRRDARQLGPEVEIPQKAAKGAVDRLDIVARALGRERSGGGIVAAAIERPHHCVVMAELRLVLKIAGPKRLADAALLRRAALLDDSAGSGEEAAMRG